MRNSFKLNSFKLIALLGHVGHIYEFICLYLRYIFHTIFSDCVCFFFAVAKIQEEKLVEEKEREQLLINFEQHSQLEQKQKDENMLVRPSYNYVMALRRKVPYSTEITPTLIACYTAAIGGMGLISKAVVLPRNYAHS